MFAGLIALLYAGITGIRHDQRDLIAVPLLIFVATGFINYLLLVLNSEYHQKYELYGVTDKRNT